MAALTDTKIRSLKPRPKLYRVADMEGLCLEVRPTGSRAWGYRYRFLGKANMLHLGDYPAMSLQDARRERDRQRDLLAQGTDPADARRQAKVRALVAADDSFESVAREWIALQGKWVASTRKKSLWLFETYAFPWIGRRPLNSITAPGNAPATAAPREPRENRDDAAAKAAVRPGLPLSVEPTCSISRSMRRSFNGTSSIRAVAMPARPSRSQGELARVLRRQH